MTDVQLYTKLSSLPLNLKRKVSDYIDHLKCKAEGTSLQPKKRIAGQAKGLISMRDNFDDPIEGFNEYV